MEFNSYKLRNVLMDKGYIRGPFGSALKRSELLQEGVPVYEQKNAIYSVRTFRYFVSKKKYEELKRFTVKPYDLLISCSGTVGRTSIITPKDPKGIISQALLILRPDVNIINPYYLYYFFQSKKGHDELINRSSGSVQVNIAKRNIIENISIDLPSISNQKKIVDFLSSLDNKINSNKNIISNLEELSQTLFKRWFVDFEFPDENGNPYKSSGGEMIDSEMGLIPKDWELKSADEIYEITIGKTPPRKLTELFSEKEGIDWVSISDMKSEGMFIKSTKEKIVEEGVVDYKVKIVPKDSVLLSFKLTIGRVKLTNKELTTNEAIAHFYSSNINKLYTYLYLKNFEYGYLGNTSSIATAVNSKIIKKMPILVPEQKVLKRFINIAEPFMNRINIIQNENIELNQLRDTLLPKLMSGEIEMPDDIEVNEDELSI